MKRPIAICHLASILFAVAGCREDAAPLTCTSIFDCPVEHDCVNGICQLFPDAGALRSDQSLLVRADQGQSTPDQLAADHGLPTDTRPGDQRVGYDIPASVAADLLIKDPAFAPTTIAVGAHPTAVGYTICNNGPKPLASPNTRIGVSFIFSANDVLGDVDDHVFGDIGADLTLKSGACFPGSLTKTGLSYLKAPQVPPGQYYFFVRVAHRSPSKLKDPYPANNVVRWVNKVTVK